MAQVLKQTPAVAPPASFPTRARSPLLPIALAFCLALPLAGCRDDEPIRVDDLTFVGVASVDEGRLRDVLATQERGWLPVGRRPAFIEEHFETDLKRVAAFYADRGFPDARVAAVDVQFNRARDAVRLTVEVDEGEPIRVSGVTLEGFDPLHPRRQDRLARLIELEPGAPRDQQLVANARDALLNDLKENGYPYARLEVREIPTAEREVALVFAAEPGPVATFGAIEIAGNDTVGDDVIRRQLTFRPGDRFRLSSVQESQRRFYALEVFDFAYVEPRIPEEPRAEVPVRVTVTEGKPRQVTFGVGYGTEEKARVSADWRHVNFFGGARLLSVESKWSSLDRGVRVGVNEPYFFLRHLSFSAQGHAWDENEPIYRLRSYGGRATVSWDRERRDPVRRRAGSNSVALTVINEFSDYGVSELAMQNPEIRQQLIALGLDPVTGAGTGTLVALRAEARRNTTGSLLDARRGYLATAAVERAGGFLPGDFAYTEVSTEGRHYVSLGRRAVLAHRVRFGAIDGPDPLGQSVPFFKRYFLGGSTSLRGWGRFEVSPLTESGFPVGGFTLLEGSSELRLPVTRAMSVVAFVDAGNVWGSPWDADFGDLRVSAGPGLRYNTPIGPVRLDLGYQLTPIEGLLVQGEPETRRWRVHFSIGQAF
jgi:outer membrane protein assembly complex protein YaeT